MKKILTLAFIFATIRPAQAGDTLRAFNPATAAPTALQFPASAPGYYTGHNSYNDEEWGEKYYITGTRQVVGMIAYHTGQAGTTTHNSYYRVYNVASGGMPGMEIAEKAVTTTSLDISGVPVYVALNSPVTVHDSFFVTFGVEEYAHNDPGTKLVAVMHAPNGTRPVSDTNRIGRNVVRWHNHNHTSMDWKDFYKENFTPVRIHLALFPVMANSASVMDFLAVDGLKVYSPFPSPAGSSISFKVEAERGGALDCVILDLAGKVLKQWSESPHAGSKTITRGVGDLATGQYVLLLRSAGGQSAQQFIKN